MNSRFRFTVRVLLFVFAFASLFLMAQSLSAAPPDEGLFVPTTKSGVATRATDPTIIRSRFVDLKLNLFDSSIAPGSSKVAQATKTLTLNLFPDVALTATLDKATVRPNGLVWTGHVDGVANSQVVFTLLNGVLAGNINTGKAFYQVRFAGNNVHQVNQINPRAFPADKKPLAVDKSKLATTQAAATKDPSDRVDVLVVYTPAASTAAGGASGVETLIDLAVSEANLSFTNSRINFQINLVYKGMTSYAESGDFDTDLARLQNPSDGFMDDVPMLRNKYGADIVTLITEGFMYCGVAFDIMNPVSGSFAPYAYNVVARPCAAGNYTYAHELGHLMSARHDWATDPTDNAPYTYNHGYVPPSQLWRTIMAYETVCPSGCPRVPYWSNPNLVYGSEPMGVSETLPQAADNAKTLNNTVPTVANFRQTVVPVFPPASPMPLSPVGTITSRLPTYSWSAVSNADSYLVWVDDASGKNILKQWYDAPKVCSGATCAVTPPVQLENVAHTWFVKAWNSAGTSGWSTPVAFTVNSVPNAVNLMSPADKTVDPTQPITYKWYHETNADTYDLQVLQGSTVVDGQTGISDPSACYGSTCQWQSSKTLLGGAYTWKVRACNVAGCGSWSTSWSFTISMPGDPILLEPPPVTSNPPVFKWMPVIGAHGYVFEMTGPLAWTSYVPAVPNCSSGTCIYQPITTPFPYGTYTWRVRACAGSTCGAFSPSKTFTITTIISPCSVTQVEPNTTSSVGNYPTFKWTYTGNCTWFSIYAYGPGGFTYSDSTPAPSCPLGTTCTATLTAKKFFLDGGPYYWYIYPVPNTSGWVGPMSFKVGGTVVDDCVSPPWNQWQVHSGTGSTTTRPPYYSLVRPPDIPGMPQLWASASFPKSYAGNVFMEATLQRFGYDWSSHGIDIYGTPKSSDGGWLYAYQFQIMRGAGTGGAGYYSVWKLDNGVGKQIKTWTQSPAIRTGDGINTLRAMKLGSVLYYYINNTLVWSGIDPYYPTLTSGRNGVFMAPSPITTPSYLDELVLSAAKCSNPLATLSLPEISAEQKALNDAANKNPQGTISGMPSK